MTKKSAINNNPATKSDVRRLEKALRADLATKKDLKKFALKTDLKRVERSLRSEILKVEERVEKVEDKLGIVEAKVDGIDERTKKMDATLDNLRNTLDGFVGRVDNLTKDNDVGTDQYRGHDVRLNDHEERITTLESPTQ